MNHYPLSSPTFFELSIASPRLFKNLVKCVAVVKKELELHAVIINGRSSLVDVYSDGSVSLKRAGFIKQPIQYFRIREPEQAQLLFNKLKDARLNILNLKPLLTSLGFKASVGEGLEVSKGSKLELHHVLIEGEPYLFDLHNPSKKDLSLYGFKPSVVQTFTYKKISDVIKAIRTLKLMGVEILNETGLAKDIRVHQDSLFVVPRNWKPTKNKQVKIVPEFQAMYGRYAGKIGIIIEVGRGFVRVRFEGLNQNESISLPKSAVGPTDRSSPMFKKNTFSIPDQTQPFKKEQAENLYQKYLKPLEKNKIKRMAQDKFSSLIHTKFKQAASYKALTSQVITTFRILEKSYFKFNASYRVFQSQYYGLLKLLQNRDQYVNMERFQQAYKNLKNETITCQQERQLFLKTLTQFNRALPKD